MKTKEQIETEMMALVNKRKALLETLNTSIIQIRKSNAELDLIAIEGQLAQISWMLQDTDGESLA